MCLVNLIGVVTTSNTNIFSWNNLRLSFNLHLHTRLKHEHENILVVSSDEKFKRHSLKLDCQTCLGHVKCSWCRHNLHHKYFRFNKFRFIFNLHLHTRLKHEHENISVVSSDENILRQTCVSPTWIGL